MSTLMYLALTLLGLCLYLLGGERRGDRSLGARAPLVRVTALLSLSVALLAGGIWQLKRTSEGERHIGVVLPARAPLRAGPAERFKAEVNIAGATLVTLQGQEGAWRRVALFDGREGWLLASEVRSLK